MDSNLPGQISPVIGHQLELSEKNGKKRLKIGSADQKITDVAVIEIHNMSFWNRLKVRFGYIKIATFTDGAGHAHRVGVNVASVAKRLDISIRDAHDLLSAQDGLNKVALLANSVVKSHSNLNQEYLPEIRLFEITRLFHRVITVAIDKIKRGEDITNFDIQTHSFIFLKRDDRLHLINIGGFIAEGTCGRVLSADDHFHPDAEIVKIAKRVTDTSIQEEHRVLNELNPGGRVVGLQLPSRVIFRMVDPRGIQRPGYLAPRYTSDLFAGPLTKAIDVKNAMLQIGNGIRYLHEKKWTHGDIKPENIFIRPQRFDLGDLGGIVSQQFITDSLVELSQTPMAIEDINLISTKVWGIGTDIFINKADVTLFLKVMLKLKEQLEAEERPDERTRIIENATLEIIKLRQARDIYAFGLTMLDTICGFGETEDDVKNNLASEDYWNTVHANLLELGFTEDSAKKIQVFLKDITHIGNSRKEYSACVENRLRVFQTTDLSAF